ncbi:MAG: methyltransferase, TIGR04325 family [Zoogloeaceae bacterium]|jgi:putative methyltransferase (TIGR04325 family)|nr:methyltransferase, TIGR04325 family [Zoogloeaceae bacterium]
MSDKLKKTLKDWLPPAILRKLKTGQGGGNYYLDWSGTWAEAQRQSTGYDTENILKKVLAATRNLVRGEAIYERDSVLFHNRDFPSITLSGLLWGAARNCGTLNVLDFGGSLGSTWWHLQKFFSELPSVRWNVVEQKHFVDVGRREFQNDKLFFYESIDECLSETCPSIILLSSVLQYIECYEDIIIALAHSPANTFVIDRTSLSNASVTRIVVQHVPKSIYEASYPMWIFSEQELLARLQPYWNVIGLAPSADGNAISSRGHTFAFKGMLLEKHGISGNNSV